MTSAALADCQGARTGARTLSASKIKAKRTVLIDKLRLLGIKAATGHQVKAVHEGFATKAFAMQQSWGASLPECLAMQPLLHVSSLPAAQAATEAIKEAR